MSTATLPSPLADGALTGITVLDLSRLLPGPYCSMILADHGARVIAVEDRRFIADGLFIDHVNRNKQHISLNLKTPQGLEVFRRLAGRADVVLEGFRPGVVQRLGVDYDSLAKDNPRLVYCSITGYGQQGPLRDRAGHDVNYIAQAGVLDFIGLPDRPPCIPGVQLADIAGGAMMAAMGIMLALLARERTGRGQYIDISMTDGVAALLPLVLHLRQEAGATPKRGDARLSHHFACYNTYQTADERHLAIGALENRFWQTLCSHLGRPEYGPLQYDEARREEILQWLRATFVSRPLVEWEAELGSLDVCFSAVRSVDEVLSDPELRRREMVVDEDHGPNLGILLRLGATPGRLRSPPPAFGADTETVLAELGYDDAARAELRRCGAV